PILVNAMPTVVEGDFEWDSAKAASNLVKHGVSFAEAATVFPDPFAVYLDDGSGIGQLVVIGASVRDRVLYVVHVERGARDRIVSARPASTAERDVYETGGSQ
ncbi:MAG: BrnT family toxin, partial [Verrucomicrobiota bacterium]